MADLKEFEKDGIIYTLKDETARNNIEALQAAVGSPLVANTAASMIDTTKIYVYTGSETGYETGHWYYYNGSAWTDGGLYQSRGIAPNSVTGAKISNVIRTTLLDLLNHVAYTDANGQTYHTALYNALYDVAVESIEAVFTQGSAVIYDTDDLDDLKQYLMVTATYEDGSELEVDEYELSGTLTTGTSVITVTYMGKTDTFNVVVSHDPLDDIAYGTLTYRDIFITNNMCLIGDFEGTYTIDSDFHTLSNGDQYKMVYSGSPSISNAEYNSPTHSLKCFNTGKVQAFYKRENASFSSGDKYLICACVNCSRYVGGSVGAIVNYPILNAVDRASAVVQSTTDEWEAKTAICTLTANRTEFDIYIGVNGSAGNADAYIDDVVLTPLPDGMTAEQAQSAYETYVSIVGGTI